MKITKNPEKKFQKKFSFKKSGIFLCFFISFSAYGQDYYCYYNKNRGMSGFDRTLKLSQSPQGRVIHQYYEDGSVVQTHDEKLRVVTSYERNSKYYKRNGNRSFFIYQLHLAKNTLLLSQASFFFPSKFKEMYGRPYTERNVRLFNKNPELINYLPPKLPKQISISYHKRIYSCEPMGVLGIKFKSIKLLLLQLMSV